MAPGPIQGWSFSWGTRRCRMQVLCLGTLIAALGLGGPPSEARGAQASKAASVQKQVKRLGKQVRAQRRQVRRQSLQLRQLRRQLQAALGQPGPAGPPGQPGDPGPPGPSTGPAGGDLTGSFPDPLIAPLSVTTPKLADDSVTGEKVLDGSLGTEELSAAFPAVHVTRASSQVIPNNPSVPESFLYFDVERYDTADMHDPDEEQLQPRLVAPVDGIYAVNASVVWSQAENGLRTLTLMRNGTAEIAADISLATTTDVYQQVSAHVRLNAGEWVEARVFQNSGFNTNIRKLGEFTPEFSMVWVAPGP